MTPELLTQIIDTWVTQYLALFCLMTIIFWAVGAYLFLPRWNACVRDALIYLVSISIIAIFLALRPGGKDTLFWAPLTWFGFSMLLVLELLWLAYLIEGIVRAIIALFKRMSAQPAHPAQPPRPRTTSYSRR
ncbi:MAG TPA: hypothetical protein VGL77_19970 [Armatimonadota bacterium]|jgi:hypothetical protein